MNDTAPNEKIRVLIVEDNPVDRYLIQEALNAGTFNCEHIVLEDGGPALKLLRRESPYENAAPPHLVILDLNLRCVDGREVLAYIRATPGLREIAVAIVSSSPADLMHAENLAADCYIRKPSDLDAFLGIGKTIWQCYLEKRHRA